MKTSILLFAIGITVFISVSCDKSDPEPGPATNVCDGTNYSFANDVQPIITSNCATSTGCRGAGSTTGVGPLTNYAQVSAAASKIHTQVSTGKMPKGGTLSTSDKNKILCWINAGAANN
jgi:hypothetical protein